VFVHGLLHARGRLGPFEINRRVSSRLGLVFALPLAAKRGLRSLGDGVMGKSYTLSCSFTPPWVYGCQRALNSRMRCCPMRVRSRSFPSIGVSNRDVRSNPFKVQWLIGMIRSSPSAPATAFPVS
jgi:hypothetical protein